MLPGLGPTRGSRNDPKRISEKDYSRLVMDLLATFGWKATHCYPLQTAHGWRTPTTSPGFPDIVAVRRDHLVALELKGYTARGDAGKATPQQIDWLEGFASVQGGHGWLALPTDPTFDTLATWLRYPADAPRRYGW